MYKYLKVTSCSCMLIMLSSCYMNKAIVQPWSEEYAPPSPSEYWTPSKRAKLVKTQVPLLEVIPSENAELSLAEIINIGLSNNASTQESWAQARAAAASYGQSQSTALPSLSIMYEYFRTRAASYTASNVAGVSSTGVDSGTSSGTASIGAQGATVFVETFSQWDPQLQLTYTIFDFGKNSANANSARQAMFYADFLHNRNLQTAVKTLTDDYYNVIYQMNLEDAYKANVLTAATTLDAAQVGLSSGVKNLSDVLQSQTSLLQNQIQLVEQQQQVVASTSQLLKDMGLPSNLPIKLDKLSDVDPKEEDLPDLENLLAYAMQSRPDFLGYGAELRSKELALKAAQREILPDVMYNLNFGKTYFSGGVNDKYDFVSYFNITMPLFKGYYFRNNIKNAQSNRDLAEAQLKDLELTLVAEVTIARNGVLVSFSSLNYAKAYLESAQKQYEVALAEYKAGVTDVLTVISAQNSLADARAKYVNNIKAWFTSLAELTYALGASTPPEFIQEELK